MDFSKITTWIRRGKPKKARNPANSVGKRFLAGADDDMTTEEYIQSLERRNLHLGKQLDISEAQKERLKKEVAELKQKITELIRNSS